MSFNRRDIGPLTQSRAAMARMSFREIESPGEGTARLMGDPRQVPDGPPLPLREAARELSV
jgi:hypothetical protein